MPRYGRLEALAAVRKAAGRAIAVRDLVGGASTSGGGQGTYTSFVRYARLKSFSSAVGRASSVTCHVSSGYGSPTLKSLSIEQPSSVVATQLQRPSR
jgi:hypothetical protein